MPQRRSWRIRLFEIKQHLEHFFAHPFNGFTNCAGYTEPFMFLTSKEGDFAAPHDDNNGQDYLPNEVKARKYTNVLFLNGVNKLPVKMEHMKVERSHSMGS